MAVSLATGGATCCTRRVSCREAASNPRQICAPRLVLRLSRSLRSEAVRSPVFVGRRSAVNGSQVHDLRHALVLSAAVPRRNVVYEVAGTGA